MRDIPAEFLAIKSRQPLTGAFEHPVLGGLMMDRAMSSSQTEPPPWPAMLEDLSAAPTAVYVNIPFCPSQCSFCGFFKTCATEGQDRYIDALLIEIEREGRLAAQAGTRISAVFVGGGTPTFLAAENLQRLLNAIGRLPLSEGAEITVEGRLSTLDGGKAEILWAKGANRLSLGIQSFDSDLRRRAGRSDSSATILRRLAELRASSPELVVIDLMYGLPGQSLASFERDLRIAADLGLEGLSAYMLKLMPSSPLFKLVKKGQESAPPPVGELALFYQRADQLLREQGYAQASGNHWRRGERDRNLYNTLAMARRDILAFGAGAGGSVGGASFFNTNDLDRYVSQVEAGEKALSFYKPAPLHYRQLNEASRAIHEGLIAFSESKENAGELWLMAKPLLEQWAEAGLLRLDGERAELTQAGVFWRGNLEFGLCSWLAMTLPKGQ